MSEERYIVEYDGIFKVIDRETGAHVISSMRYSDAKLYARRRNCEKTALMPERVTLEIVLAALYPACEQAGTNIDDSLVSRATRAADAEEKWHLSISIGICRVSVGWSSLQARYHASMETESRAMSPRSVNEATLALQQAAKVCDAVNGALCTPEDAQKAGVDCARSIFNRGHGRDKCDEAFENLSRDWLAQHHGNAVPANLRAVAAKAMKAELARLCAEHDDFNA